MSSKFRIHDANWILQRSKRYTERISFARESRLKRLSVQATMVDQVYNAILTDISEGTLAANSRLIQGELALALGVSRQPVQQALLLLRSHGFLREATGRGLIVAPIDSDFVQDLYELRAALEGTAARLAARRGAERARREGAALIEAGNAAIKSGSVGKMIAADMKFHQFVYEISGNRLIRETTDPHWRHLRRIIGEVLRQDNLPRNIWDQHAAILEAIRDGDEKTAERLAQDHIAAAAAIFAAGMATPDATGSGAHPH
jgi:DNA-binding GntR family transcriptional regulator